MQYTFQPRTRNATHTRTSDDVAGVLHAHDDDAVIRPLSALVDAEDYSEIEQPAPTVIIPHEIANWRARAVLEIAGLLGTVENALEALTGNEGIVARAAWNSGAPFVRNGPTIVALSAALSLTSEQVDAMFLQAASLTV